MHPPGLRGDGLLGHYATRLPTVELNNTFYARPTRDRIARWVAATPSDFRFVVKGQRGAAFRALRVDAAPSIAWLTEPLPAFGERLEGGPLPHPRTAAAQRHRARRAARRLATRLPLVTEFQHASWHVDETFEPLRAAGAVLCTTDLDDLDEPPPIRRTGPFLYLRLRRTATRTPTSTRGPTGSPHSSTTGWTPTSCSATTRQVRTRSGRRSASAWNGRAAAEGRRRRVSLRRASPPGARRRELQLGGDVVEAMGHAGRNVERVAGPDVTRLVSGGEPGATGHHDVDLVLGVGLLTIRSAGGQHVQADGQIGDP